MAVRVLCATLFFCLAPAAGHAASLFQGDLDPCPEDNSTRDAMVGVGHVTATLTGNRLTIEGHFSGFASPATAAHLNQGLAMGAPGPSIAALTVTQGEGGDVSGQVELNPAQLGALGKGALYVQLDSEKAPTGNSWAWLESGSP